MELGRRGGMRCETRDTRFGFPFFAAGDGDGVGVLVVITDSARVECMHATRKEGRKKEKRKKRKPRAPCDPPAEKDTHERSGCVCVCVFIQFNSIQFNKKKNPNSFLPSLLLVSLSFFLS